MSGGSSYLFLF